MRLCFELSLSATDMSVFARVGLVVPSRNHEELKVKWWRRLRLFAMEG